MIYFFIPALLYEIVIGLDQEKYTYLNDLLKENNLKILASKRVKKENHIICTWVTNGKPKAHLNIMRDLIDDEDVISFDC